MQSEFDSPRPEKICSFKINPIKIMRSNKKITTWIVVGVLAVLIGSWIVKNSPAKLDDFARCLKDKGAIFYGAFWCPHCQNQKKLFGRSERLLPYVECSTPDGQSQKAVCTAKNIDGYPTWEFADLSRLNGEVSLENLSEKTNCPLP